MYDLKIKDVLPENAAADLPEYLKITVNLEKSIADMTVNDLFILALPLMRITEGKVFEGVFLPAWCLEKICLMAFEKSKSIK